MNKVSTRVSPDIDSLSREAADIFVRLAKDYINSKGVFTVALSGGTTPARMYGLLSSDEYSGSVDWSKIIVFWGDERCVPKDHPDSNFRTAWELLLSKVPIPESNIKRMRGECTPEEGAREYEGIIREILNQGVPSFDLIYLGMGEDGHTASLFPGTDALTEKERLAVPVYVDKLKSWRITLTLPVFNNAGNVVFMVSGMKKAGVLSDILGKAADTYPAGRVRPQGGNLIWVLDRDAAAELSSV